MIYFYDYYNKYTWFNGVLFVFLYSFISELNYFMLFNNTIYVIINAIVNTAYPAMQPYAIMLPENTDKTTPQINKTIEIINVTGK